MKTFVLAFLPLVLASALLPAIRLQEPVPHSTRFDGPYVLYRDNQVFVKYILDEHGVKKVQADSTELSKKESLQLQVATDDPARMFTVKLKKDLQNEKTDFSSVSKMFIVSDIEGNFSAFRKILQGAGIVDADYNWTFGTGHLVLTGDFVDRGSQVNEVLWLIYSLEGKAKAAGGYVHYILGNHEIMNMNGDLRYVHAKYMQSAGVLNEGFTSLYGEQSELGRWLRTKNVMEKIGDILFVHAGISPPVNTMDLSTSRLNKLVKPHYADSLMEFKNPLLDILYSDLGPFWYRGYYKDAPGSHANTLDSTLRLYKVKKVATGHTVVADTISVLYNGKLINTDVHHLGGHTEGLLIEEGAYYRVLPSGEKKRIM